MAEKIIQFLIRLKELGIKISLDGDKLQASASEGVMTQEIGKEIIEKKYEIISFLQKTTVKTKELDQIIHDEENRFEEFPLTDVQQAYWIGRSREFELGNVATHMYMEFEQEDLDISRLENAWNILIKRHDMLRAVVHSNGMQQVIKQVPEYSIKVTDLRKVEFSHMNHMLLGCRNEMSHQVMPADQWPLFDVRISILDNGTYRIHMSIDLLIADALSWQILFKELGQIYLDSDAPLTSIDVTFRDFVYAEIAMKKTELYKRSNEYWMERIKNLPSAPELPLIKSPASVSRPQFVRRQATLEKNKWEKLAEHSRQEGFTPSVVLMEAFSQILSHWSKSPRFTINLTLFNRLPLHTDINNVIGDFTSLTLLEIHNTYNESFTELTRRLQNQLWKDLDHRYVGGIHVMRELNNLHGGSNTPVMPVVFTSDLANVSGEMMKEVYGISQTPQVWIDHQVIEQNGNLILNWDCVEELFPEGMLSDMFATYKLLLDRLADDETAWNLTMGQLVSKTDQQKIAMTYSKKQPDSSSKTVNQLFNQRVEMQPDNIAVVAKNKAITYQELSCISNKVANWIRENNENILVAVIMEKGWEQVTATLGILQAGFAYLPISADLPEERIGYLLANGDITTVLTQTFVKKRVKLPERMKILCVDQSEELENIPDTLVQIEQNLEDIAYVIYTSGSTGQPKGVIINHGGVVNTIRDINERFHITNTDKVLALSELNFDLSVYDLFGILVSGGTVVIPDFERKKDPQNWLDIIKEEEITIWNSVPALLEMLMEYVKGSKERLPNSFRLALLSGDWIPVGLPEELRELAQNVEIISLGGATEASIWSVCYKIGLIDKTWKSIPYGKALQNQTIYVLDEELDIRFDWVPGQIYIGGMGLALGYWKDEIMTANKFFIHPKTGERLYRTGDMGCYLPDGNIEFLGREDYQVKIQGHRIELGEIESVLNVHPVVKSCIVQMYEEDNKRKIVAYIVKNKMLEQHNEASFQDIIEDPVERLRFKLSHKNYRKVEERDKIEFKDENVNNKILEMVLRRRSYRNYGTEAINKRDLLSFLSYFQHVKFENLPTVKAGYASAGSLYPVQIYLYIKKDRVEGFDGGVYYYHPGENKLYLISKNATITEKTFVPGNREIFEKSAFAVFLVGNQEAIEPLYGNWSKDFMIFEAGIIAHMLETYGPEYNIGLCQIGNYDFEKIAHWFSLGESQSYIHCLLGGRISKSDQNLTSLIQSSKDVIEMASNINLNELDDYEPPKRNPGLSLPLKQENLLEEGVAILEEALTEDIKLFLYSKLPEYMVPSIFISIDQIPLSPNGKIDRKALPLPNKQLSRKKKEYEVPSTYLEIEIAHIWMEVLNLDKIGIHDSLFELGGNSVDIVKIYNLLKERLNDLITKANFQIKEFFRFSTIYEISNFLDEENIHESERENISLIEQDINYKMPKMQEQISAALPVSAQSTFLLTGATGYLGAHILYELITQTTQDIYCLVRADSREDGQNRIKRYLSKLKLWTEEFLSRIKIVCGDLELPEFGNKDEFEMLSKKTDIIIHCGGWVNFVYPYEALQKSNVESVKEIIKLASTYRIKPINFVSSLTTFPLSGNSNGEPYYENEDFKNYEMLVNGYSQTKWVGEKILEDAKKNHIPVNTYRPAFMVGHSKTGTSNEKDIIWALIKGTIQLGKFSDLGAIQLVTVDYVSQFIVNAAINPDLYSQNYNLISPELTDFNYIFERIKEFGYSLEEECVDDWIERIQSLENKNALAAFSPFLMSITGSEIDSGFGSVLYDDTNAKKAICDTTIESYQLDDQMLENCVEYLVDIEFLEEVFLVKEDVMEDTIKSYKNMPYRLWNPFTDLEEFKNQVDYGPNVIVRAQGPYIYNAKGQKYINAASSLWNVAVGHGREEIIEAATKQMRQLSYSSCFRQTHPKAMELADKLVNLTGGYYSQVYLGCNGSEAVEAAFKMTRQYFRQSPSSQERSKYKIISLKGSYHGVTIAGISSAGDEEEEKIYGPLVPGFIQIEPPYCYRCPYNAKGYPECNLACAQSLEDIIIREGAQTCAAFILEPVMGVYGLVPLPVEFFNRIGAICRQYNILLIADEVTTGFGRTGTLFASEDWEYRPDILILGKGISSGYLPLSATMATLAIYERFRGRSNYFHHGSTASGHPVCAAAGIANIDIIINEKIVENSFHIGNYLLKQLHCILKDIKIIGDVRGRGMMIGIELVKDKKSKSALSVREVIRIVNNCYSDGLYVYLAPNLRTIGLFPPLIIDKTIADEIINILYKNLQKY